MIDPYRGRQIPDRLLMAQDKKRIWILAILFLVVLAAFFGLQIWAQFAAKKEKEKAEGKSAPAASGSPIDVAPKRDAAGRTVFNVLPRTVEERRDLAEDDLALELGKLAADGDLLDGRKEDSPEVLDYLLQQVTWEYSVTKLPRHVYRRLPERKVAHDPSRYRGRLTSAFGKVVWRGEMEEYPTDVKQVKSLQRAEFRTAGGSLYHVVSTLPIERNVGEWMQVYGIFYRNRPATSSPGETAFTLVLTYPAEKGYPPIEVTEIDPKWADEILDENYDQANRLQERPFWLLLNYAKNLGIEGYREEKEAGRIEVVDFEDMARPLVRRPGQYRLSFVSATGKLISELVEYFDVDNPGKITRLDSAILLQPSGYLVRLASPRPWEDYGIRVGQDFVRVEGVYYKRWQYIPREGTVPFEIPLVVVTDIQPVDKATQQVMGVLQYVFLGLAAVIVLVFLVHALRDRKARAAFRERVREKASVRESP